MQTRFQNPFISALVVASLALTLTVPVRGQSDPTPKPEETPVLVVAPAEPAAVESSSAEVEGSDLRRLDVATPATPADEAVVPEDAVAAVTSDADGSTPVPPRHRRSRHSEGMPLGNHTIPAGIQVRELVSILGNSVLDGETEDAVVSILGNTTVNGKAGAEAVAVLGNVYINGEVGGEVVAVLGNVTLGPKAVVHGEVVTVLGRLQRDAAAVVHGEVQEITVFGHRATADWLSTWFHECLLKGRPLAFNLSLLWAWSIAIVVFGFYVLLALLFPKAFEACAETLEQNPAYSLLAVLLSALITPVLIVLLVFTGIGIVLIPFVMMGLFVGSLFGKAVMHAWLGRRITKYFGSGPMSHVAMATLLGGLLILLLYTVPYLGLFLWKVLSMIGLGVVAYTLLLKMGAAKSAPTISVSAPPAPSAGGVAVAAVIAPQSATASSEASPGIVPPTLPLSALPRAGFWLRIAASLLDTIIVGIITGMTGTGSWFLLLFFIYCVVLWTLKGTTIGGVICGLKVVRLDDRPVDWTVSIVRGLAGFLSLAVAGLGFVWVSIDSAKQSWHDKIAGTVVVCAPKGSSLI